VMSYRFDIDNEDEFLLFSCCLFLHLLKMQLWNTLTSGKPEMA